MNEVLRRKLFNKVMNANQPAGILASSPEMVETVQRRANGGMNSQDAQYIQSIAQLAQQGDKGTLQNIFADTRLSTNVRNAAREALGSLATKRADSPTMDFISTSANQLARMPGEAISDAVSDAARAGQGILDFAGRENQKFVDSIKAIPASLGETMSGIMDAAQGLKTATVPDIMSSLTPEGIEANRQERLIANKPLPTDTRATRLAKNISSSLENVPSPIEVVGAGIQGLTDAAQYAFGDTPYMPVNEGDPRYRPGTVPTASSGKDIVDDEYTTGVPKTPGELIVPVSGSDTQTKAPADSSPKTAVGALQSIFSGVAKKSDVTTAFESDIKNINDAFLTGVTENRSTVIDAEDRLKKATEVFDDAFSKERAKGKEFSLKDVRDEALKISGIDKKDYDENRKDAFWMGLMRAGLGIAAGESDNTLSNVAKGLGFGLEGYGKDIATLNAQEREDRKELRAISMDLIKTKNDKSMAEAAAENDFNYNQQRMAQASVQGADAALLQAQNREASHKLTGLQLDANLSYQLNSLKQKDNQLASDTAYKEWALKVSMLPDEAKQVMMIDGYGSVDPETGMFKVSPEGEEYYKKLLTASTSTGYKVTDLDKGATAAADVGNIFGVKLSKDSVKARNQALYWASTFQDAYNKAAGESLNGPQLRKELLETFAKDIAEPIDLTSN